MYYFTSLKYRTQYMHNTQTLFDFLFKDCLNNKKIEESNNQMFYRY